MILVCSIEMIVDQTFTDSNDWLKKNQQESVLYFVTKDLEWLFILALNVMSVWRL